MKRLGLSLLIFTCFLFSNHLYSMDFLERGKYFIPLTLDIPDGYALGRATEDQDIGWGEPLFLYERLDGKGFIFIHAEKIEPHDTVSASHLEKMMLDNANVFVSAAQETCMAIVNNYTSESEAFYPHQECTLPFLDHSEKSVEPFKVSASLVAHTNKKSISLWGSTSFWISNGYIFRAEATEYEIHQPSGHLTVEYMEESSIVDKRRNSLINRIYNIISTTDN